MRCTVIVLCALGLLSGCFAKEEDKKQNDDKKPDKRGVVEVQGPSAYATAAPGFAGVSHGPTILPSVTAAPGIVYAPEKQILATASPSQLFAKPSPHLAKISDVVLGQNHAYSGVVNPLYQAQQAYQPIGKLGYSVSAPIPSHLAYSKHQIIQPQQQVYHQQHIIPQQPHVYQQQVIPQPQVHYQPQLYQQPQLIQPQITHYAHPNLVQPQVSYVQPQIVQQPHPYHAQQLAHQVYQHPQAVQQLQRVAIPQPLVAPQLYSGKSEGAVSYASFSQGHPAPQQYQAKQVNYAQPILGKQLVGPAPIYQQYYQQPQLHQAYPQGQEYSVQPQLFAPQARVYPQPQVAYATQYFGKIAQGSPIAYAGYNH